MDSSYTTFDPIRPILPNQPRFKRTPGETMGGKRHINLKTKYPKHLFVSSRDLPTYSIYQSHFFNHFDSTGPTVHTVLVQVYLKLPRQIKRNIYNINNIYPTITSSLC